MKSVDLKHRQNAFPLEGRLPKSYTSGRLLARNTILNLLGHGIPMLIALIAIPFLIKGLGTEKFGVLTLVWVVIGYFSLFDFGLGRALTKLVAEKIGSGDMNAVPIIIWTTLSLMTIFGFVGALILGLLSNKFVLNVLKVSEILRTDTLYSFYLLSFSVPIVINTVALRGVLEALQRFDFVIGGRLFMGAFTYISPLVVFPLSRSLFAIVLVLVFGRILTLVVHFILCLKALPSLHTINLSRKVLKPLIKFGGWMTTIYIIGASIGYLDRFLIGAMLPVSVVAYYTTPHEVVTRLQIIPGALVGVILPAFSASLAIDNTFTKMLFLRAVKYIFIVMFPITLFIVMFASEGLTIWLGPEFANQSGNVLKWLAVGLFMFSISQVNSVLVQGIGRPDLLAKLILLQLPFYLLLTWYCIIHYGIEGASFAWTARLALDTAFIFIITKRILVISALQMYKMAFIIVLSLCIFGFGSLNLGLSLKIVFFVLILVVFLVVSWTLFLGSKEQAMIKDICRSII